MELSNVRTNGTSRVVDKYTNLPLVRRERLESPLLRVNTLEKWTSLRVMDQFYIGPSNLNGLV